MSISDMPYQPLPLRAAFAIDVNRIGRRAVVDLSGEIDLAAEPALRQAIADSTENGAQQVWVDLSRATFMDSSGIHALLDARDALSTLNRRLVIICPPGPVRRTFEAANLDDVLPLYASRVAAHYMT
jgi:anti-sigma B factor antagonist